MPPSPTFKDALTFWLKLGFISFGGPAGQIAIMHEFLVEKKKWIQESDFLHALNYCMLLPGPEAQQLATYIGWKLHGTKGGLAAGILFVLPSVFILMGLSIVYVSFGNLPWVSAAFLGLKPAVIAIIILSLLKIGKKSLLSLLHILFACVSFVAIFYFNISFPVIITGTMFLSWMINRFLPDLSLLQSTGTKPKNTIPPTVSPNVKKTVPLPGSHLWIFFRQTGIFIILWVIPFLLFSFRSTDFPFWKNLILFFSKAAWVTFGGAYAVLPYVSQVSVNQMQWLSGAEMLDGLALGETTPGPLIMVLAYVGFMAGYHHHGNSVGMGALGLLVTTYYTFLPCFYFIFAGASLIEQTQENPAIKKILLFVNASVTGGILSLCIHLSIPVLFRGQTDFQHFSFPAFFWVLLSLFVLNRFKDKLILWIGVSILYGLVIWGLRIL